MKNTINFLLVGVGGQGTILASNLLAEAGLATGLEAKQAEVHGMSQRGGSVTSHVRWGKTVHSPLIGAGEVDIYLAFEQLEALRYLNWLRPGGVAMINLDKVMPLSALSGEIPYPGEERLRAAVNGVTSHGFFIDAARIATSLGNSRTANVVLLGALAQYLEENGPIDAELDVPGLTREMWLKSLEAHLPPRYLELNRQAFQAGREALKVTGPVHEG